MKFLLGLLIGCILMLGVMAGSELFTLPSDEAAFGRLPLAYQEIPVYPDARNVWKGNIDEKILTFPVTRIISFNSANVEKRVLEFYKSALPSHGWTYVGRGIVSSCSELPRDGDFYKNTQNDFLWVATHFSDNRNFHFEVFRVSRPFSYIGECV